ncbi:hypothetical protein J2Z17_004942 [Rhizobium halophytocola]|uniref:Uncharacterized protein n=1 Tax=Rhizobium halophytocola TaxID=735519 RepID=A0ABS4E6B6_9HYPH|nr:hypothetical protein [Rhizobium halophytocola]
MKSAIVSHRYHMRAEEGRIRARRGGRRCPVRPAPITPADGTDDAKALVRIGHLS